MKNTLRYLLIAILMSMTSVLSATNVAAQNLAQRPEVQMHSTSGMVYSGSTLPSAAVQGTYVTGTAVGTYSPANASGPHRAKRGASEEDGGDTPPPDPHGPNEDPLGDAAIPLMLLCFAYAIYKVRRRMHA